MKDLHIHTKYSDGEDNEFEILQKIKKVGINEFAICDHDNLEGSQKVHNLLKKENSNLIFHTGVELSCIVNNYKSRNIDVHLLVRDFDYYDENILFLINKISSLRKQKIQRMVDLIKQVYNIHIKQSEINNTLKETNSFGKPHMYKILATYGNYDREEFFQNMRKLKSSDLKLDVLEVINKLKNTQGYVTLAHPIEIMKEYNMSYEDIDELVKYLSSKGLDGLETKHSTHTKEDADIFSKIAKKYNLKETEGSDYHGPNIKPTIKLGICEKKQ
jgi:predicted metal-dependent phosphoesterase TrpH